MRSGSPQARQRQEAAGVELVEESDLFGADSDFFDEPEPDFESDPEPEPEPDPDVASDVEPESVDDAAGSLVDPDPDSELEVVPRLSLR